ncbi:MAG: uroporphyrinogen-III synthase, partial [Vicinamibacteria bacterium]
AVPEQSRGEAVAEAIIARHGASLEGARVLLPRAEVAREALPERLRAVGARVDVVTAYRTLPPAPEERARLRELIERGAVDALTLTSTSTLDNTLDAIGDDAPRLLGPLTIASIGPITTEAAERRGLRVAVTAAESTAEGLVAALTRHFEETR